MANGRKDVVEYVSVGWKAEVGELFFVFLGDVSNDSSLVLSF